MKQVLFIEAEIKRYRAPFYKGLHAALQSQGIQMTVAYSEPRSVCMLKHDQCDLPSEYSTKVRGFRILNRFLLQPLFRRATKADLIIADEGNRYLLSHLLLPFSACKLKKLALWGMGENRQPNRLAFSEWYRKKTLRCITWWFAYTSGTAQRLIQHGFPSERITTVQNAIDTRELCRCVADFSEGEVLCRRSELGIPPSAPVGVYCGMLKKIKEIPFLLESARLVRRRIPDFHLIIVGGAAENASIEEQLRFDCEWIHWVGAKFGAEKALFLRMGDVFMMPSGVGLAILDSFAAGLPLFATSTPVNGPEMEYLENGRNGVITENDVEVYAQALVDVLSNPSKLSVLKEGANRSCEKYSIEAMVDNFSRGIRECLNRG
jgi:glycosyltransferase involved in cell wall biosynthesis